MIRSPDDPIFSVVPKRLHRIESRGAGRRVESREQADDHRESDRSEHKPKRHKPYIVRSELLLALHVHAGSEVDDSADDPARQDSERAAKDSHCAGFGEEELLHVAVAGPDCLHDSDFAATFENRHHQRIDNSQRSHSQREAAKNAQEQIENGKESPQVARSVEKRECVVAKLLDLILDSFYLTRSSRADDKSRVVVGQWIAVAGKTNLS